MIRPERCAGIVGSTSEVERHIAADHRRGNRSQVTELNLSCSAHSAGTELDVAAKAIGIAAGHRVSDIRVWQRRPGKYH